MTPLKALYQNLILLTEKLEDAIDRDDDGVIANLLDRRDHLLARAEAHLTPDPEAQALIERVLELDSRCQAKLERKITEAKAEMQALNHSSKGITSYLNAMVGASTPQVFDHDQ